MALVASVDYPGRRIMLSADSVGVNLDTLDVYREVRALRRVTEEHRFYRPMIVAGGNIEKIPGVSATPAYVQLLYGCRIVPYNASHALRLIRDTFTDDGLAGRNCFDRTSLSASVEVDIDVDIQEVEIRIVATGGSTLLADERAKLMAIPTAQLNADTMWAHASAIEIQTRLSEAWGRLGLDPSKPLVSGQTSITFGDLVMQLTGDATESTLTRQ